MEDFKKLKQSIINILKKDNRIWNEEKTELNQTLLLDLIDKIDEKLINLLLEEKETRNKFFVKIKEVYVFKTNEFKFFMEENKVDNSYTQYKNRIGLTDGKRFLKYTNDVVLNFPFKDCVLEGGMTKEDQKRNEIFFNQILAKDEIDRLEDEKALVNWKRFTSGGEQEVKKINRDENGTIKENLIIKGNNLLALHSLKKQFSGKVKLIYIDPPYNTGGDSFKYNDSFNHSTWLTFMKNRLEVAKELLRDDGTIFIQCDDSEAGYLKVLMDEIFGRENFRNAIFWHRTYAGKTISKNLPWNVDTILFYSKNETTSVNNITRELTQSDILSFNKEDNDGKGKYGTVSLQKTGGPGPKTTYDYIDLKGRIWKCPKKGWRMVKEKLKALERDNRLYITNKTIRQKYYLNERLAIGKQMDNFWGDVGNMNRSKGENLNFSGQKPEALIQRIMGLGSNEGDLVIDFFSGSGSTGSTAMKMKRQFILIEQIDAQMDVQLKRLKDVTKGDQSGISKAVNWKGGGDFIYCELAKWNEQAKEEINNCKSLKELEKLFETLYEKYFLNYNLKIKEFKEKVIKEAEFQSLSLNEQKKMFLTMLDLNQMYVQKTEMSDKRFDIDKKDQKLTLEFYGGAD